MQGWDDLVGWLHTEMVYQPKDCQPSKPGPTSVTFVHVMNSANHYATLPTTSLKKHLLQADFNTTT